MNLPKLQPTRKNYFRCSHARGSAANVLEIDNRRPKAHRHGVSTADQPAFTNREIAELPVEKLVAYFMAYEVRRETSFKMQGRIIHSLMGKLPLGKSIFGLLTSYGVAKGSISNACYAAKAFDLVLNGGLTEADYDKMTFRTMQAMFCERPAKKTPIRENARTLAEDDTPEGILDSSIPVEERLAVVLQNAQTALMAARELIQAEHLPREWDAELTKAITATTRVRFLSKEAAEPARLRR